MQETRAKTGATAREEAVFIEAPGGAPSEPSRPGGATLAGRLFLPAGAPVAAVVLHGAAGVPRDYYAAFAEWLARERGAAALIYAYRGCEARQSRSALRRSQVGMVDWALHDQGAALAFMAARFPGAELRVIGHSMGGFGTMLHGRADAVARLTAVCSGPALWTRARGAARAQAFGFWHGLGQAALMFHGYIPGKLFGLGADLPPNVYRDWRRWCTGPDLHKGDWGGALPMPADPPFSGRLTLVSAADDDTIPTAVVEDMARFYPGASGVETRVMDPAALGLESVGHIGGFSRRAAAAWPMIAD
ncbi:alpha/beta hydrolase family protein [Rhodovulum sp. DZ06]|uniref:alpha/beta hydrolase family protein n=1 Tax=Rhodovulum sp. DZ06 TaxID=3425126 RepID=UPI003D33AD2A